MLCSRWRKMLQTTLPDLKFDGLGGSTAAIAPVVG